MLESLKDAGDFKQRDHHTRVLIVDHAIHVRNRTYWGSPNHQKKAALLETNLAAFKLQATSYRPDVRAQLVNIYRQATTPDTSQISQILNRISSQPNGLTIVSDFDGTYTNHPVRYLYELPGNRFALPKFTEIGRERFALIHEASFVMALTQIPELYKDAADFASFRPGINRFHEYCLQQGIDVTILSANFELFIKEALNRQNIRNTNVWGIEKDNITAIAKGNALNLMATKAAEQGKALLFIGDSESDLPALEATDVIAGFLALKDAGFAKALHKRGIPYLPFNDFNQATAYVQQVTSAIRGCS